MIILLTYSVLYNLYNWSSVFNNRKWSYLTPFLPLNKFILQWLLYRTSPPSVKRLSRKCVGASTSHNPMGLHAVLQGYVRFKVFTVVTMQTPAQAGSSLADFSTLKMEAIRSSETSVHTRSTRRHIPEDGIHYRDKFFLVTLVLYSTASVV
jgi:hypothetical protein